ncbi:ATP-binding cassette sub-family A member 13 [Pteropus medius]|uniref:ATP-binding cassette sub-family A member 13 n=1 Tax=Pteropus vampyrus TaxID=132908 RepID=UPI00196A9AB7|nr:ATP-binding cassette sub-family A member 13 [Pteropus giganteus]
MGPAAGQFRALLWKNGLCRLRTPVLSLAEFFWPCILFMILTVLRFQEPPRHRDDCYLQPRDLPSRGVFPFVQSLLCNTGSRCRNSSHAGSMEHRFRSSRFQAAAGRPGISDLDFLQEMQELAEDIYGVMGKATSLQKLWAEGSQSPDSSYGAGFLTRDLNKTEEVVSKLERLQQQPHVWDLLRSLPRLAAGGVPADDGVRSAGHLLRAVSKLLTSLEDLGWLPLDPTFARVSEIVLNVTISTLTFLQERGVAATESGYGLSLHSVLRDPRKAWADLKSRFGFDDLPAERGLSHSAELQEVARRRQDGGLQEALAEAGRRLQARTSQLRDGSPSRDVAEALLAGLFLLNGSLAADGATGSPTSPDRLFHTLEDAHSSPAQTRHWKALASLIRGTCEVAWRVNVPDGPRGGPPGESRPVASSEASPCYEENMDWKVVGDNYFAFLNNILESPVASTSRAVRATKELLTEKFHASEDERVISLLSCMDFLEKLLPESFYLPSGPTFHSPPSLTEAILNTSLLWTKHLKSLERDTSGMDTWKHLEFGEEINEKRQTLDKNESRYILRFMELILFKINPKLLELWTYNVTEEERAELEILSALLNFSVLENKRILSKCFNFSQFFHSDWPEPSAVKMDFVHISEAIISSLYELGFLRQEQALEALDAVYAVRNVSRLFSAPSEQQRQEADMLLTHISLNVFKDKDSALLLQACSPFYQRVTKFFSLQSAESLLSFLTQISKHVSEITKQFNSQDISKALAFLYETTEFLGEISEVPSCQQLLSVFSFLELRAQQWMSAEGPGWEVVLATLTGLKRRLSVDEDFRVSLFRYMNHLFNSSGEALLGSECFALDHKSLSFVNDSADGGAPFIFQWPQILSNLSANGSTSNEFAALRCAVSCLRMWAGVWSSVSQILKADANIFSALHVGLTRLLDELESDVNISKSCQGLCPTHHPAKLILDLFKNISRADGFQDWDAFLNLGDVWAASGEESVGVKSLNLGQIEKSLFTLETALRQLQARPLNASASDVFAASSDAPEDVDENVLWINHLLSKSLTRYGGKFESIITDLRETMLFLRNVALDQDLSSCAAMFQNVTEFISEDGLLYVNPLQRTLRILAVLKSTFSSEDSIRRLKGCAKCVDTINQLRMAYNPSFSQGRLQGLPRHFRDMENKINSTRKLVTWLLTIMESDCPLNKSNINCVNSFLKNLTDFLRVVLTAVLEKEKIPNSEILLTLLNDSTNHVRMIINNLTRDFEFASQSNWKHFIELILRPVEASDEIPSQFQHLWLHLVALGKEIKKLAEDISLNVLENNSSSKMETFLNTFAPSPKEKDINSFSNSVFHLASYLSFNLSHDLQNSPQIILHKIAKAVGLGVQVIRGVFDSLMPSTRHGTPGDPGSRQALKKVTALLRAVRKPDLDLLVDQLEQVGDGLVDFFRNVSGLGTGTSGVSLLVGLMEKLVDSSHSWDVSHLLRLARLFPREDVNAAVDAYYALPQAARLLRGLADKNITGALQDVYDFTLLHGVRISGVTKEDFAAAIKALLDSVALVSEKPGLLAEALTCLPVLRCRNHTAAGFRQDPRFGACDRPESASSSFYGNVASVLERLRLSPPGEVSWCSNETSRTELTRRMVCGVHGLVDWSSIFLELFRVLHAETSLGKSVREFWRKALPSVPPSGLCPSGPLKHVALQIVEKLKNVNLTEVTSHENMFDKLAGLSKILSVNESTGASARGISVNLGRIMKLLSGDRSLENSTQSLLSALTTFLNADRTGRDLDAFSSSMEQSAALYDLREPWPESEHITEDLNYDVKIRAPPSDVNNDAQMMNSVALQDVTLHLVQFLESLHSSAQALEITKDFLSVTKNWLCKYANGDYARMIQTLCLMANESSTDDLALSAKDITTFLSYLRHIPREGDFDGALLSQLADPEEPANFSVVQSLLESFLINSINNLAGSSQEAAWSLSDSDLQIMNSINLALNRTQSERGEGITLPLGSRLGRVERLLKTFFFLQKERPANETSPLGVVAEPSFVPQDKILEILKGDPFLASVREDGPMSNFSSLKEITRHLIESAFALDNGDVPFDKRHGPEPVRGVLRALVWEIATQSETEKPAESLTVASRLLSHVRRPAGLVRLGRQLWSALHLVRETSAGLARLVQTLLHSRAGAFRSRCPALQRVILAKLTGLLSLANSSFPLRDRAALDITARWLTVLSGAGRERGVREPLLDASAAAGTLASASAGVGGLAAVLDSAVRLLELATAVSGKGAAISGTRVVPTAHDSAQSFDTLCSTLRQSLRDAVSEMASGPKTAARAVLDSVDGTLAPALGLAFGMAGVRPAAPHDPAAHHTSSCVFSSVNRSEDFASILKEIAEFLTSGEINSGDAEHFPGAISNGTRMFSTDSSDVWEEILGCLVPIVNLVNQIDFLHPNRISARGFRQDAHGVALEETLSQNSPEMGTRPRRAMDLIPAAFRNNLEGESGDGLNSLPTFAQHPDIPLKAIEAVVKASSGTKGDWGGDSSEALVFSPSLLQTVAPLGTFTGPAPNGPQGAGSTGTPFQGVSEIFGNAAAGKNAASGLGEGTEEAAGVPPARGPSPSLEDGLEGLAALAEHWQKVSLTDESVADMCQGRGWSVKMLLLRGLLEMMPKAAWFTGHSVFPPAENPSLAKDVVCAARGCPRGGLRLRVLCALHAATVLSDHFQELERAWSSPPEPRCVHLRGRLSSSWGRFRSGLADARLQDCGCQPAPDAAGQRVRMLAQSLEKTLFSRNPILTLLSNFTVTADVEVKDVMKNVTRFAEDLRASAHVSEGTISSILEANLSRSPVLWSALTVALSARCDRESLRPLLALPEPAAGELCRLPGANVYALMVSLGRNLDLRNLVYKALVPADARRVLSSLLDVVSGLSRLLPKAGHVLELLPDFLRASEITALLDVAGAPEAPHGGRAGTSAFGSFQSVMKMVCKEQEPVFSNSHTFIDLPRVGELLAGDRGKLHIPEDSTPFCLKLYQEILQSPNGALVWSFFKPILHGKILYTPDTPEIKRVIQKANYTFSFVDKLKTLSETLLKISSIFPSGGNGQMLEQLQEALRNKFVRNFVESQLHIDVDKLTDKLQTYGGALGKLLGHAGAGRVRWLGHILVNLSSCVSLNRFQPLPSVTDLEATARELLQQNSFLASVIFDSPSVGRTPRLPPHVTYTLRTSVSYSMRTDLVKNPFWKFHPQSLPADGFKYNYVFVPLQDMIETAIVLVQTGQEAAGPAVQAQAAPYPCHSSDLFLNNVGFFFPLIMMLAWVVSVASMVRKLVYEREIRLEEYLRMMGVHPTTSFLAWFVENVAVLTAGSAALAAVLRASGIFAHSDAFLVFLFLLDFAVSVAMLSYLLSACFSHANTAALCASLLYMVSFLPYVVLLVLRHQLSVAAQTLLCLLSTTAFAHGVFFITFLEGQEAGLQWANVGQAPEQAGMTFAWVCWMILLDSVLYFLCGWYLSNLIPGTFGFRRPWHFPFAASYWKDVCGLVAGRPHTPRPDLFFLSGDSGVEGSSLPNGKGKQDGGPLGVTLVSVTKEYEPRRAAVRDLTFTFHRDQITALLGANGAGKTTVISMLTGLCPPTSGAILIDGRDLHTDPSVARSGLGVCLQQDVLLAGLTVLEHLLLFASVKVPQWTQRDLRQQVDRTLEDVGLMLHRHTQTRALSGGLRRRLSIGIAFLGTSRTVVLDEPTSGVDTCSRRSIWDILLKYREGRTVIFTTHHLDEAEALSDCVAVLQQGGLRVCGPPAHLTEAYGQGLSLTLTRQPSVPGADDAKDTARITSLIQTYVPHAVLKRGSEREMSYAVPREAGRAHVQGLFQALEQNLCRLRLAGCGVSDTSLEEVFLMLLQDPKKQPDVAPGSGWEPQSPPPPELAPGQDGASAETPPARGGRLLLSQMCALLTRRLRHTRRAWKATLADLLLPVLFVALAMGLFMVRPLAIDFPPLKLTPGHYERAETYFFSESEDTGLARVLLRKFADQDVLCADRHPDLTNSSSCWRAGPPPRPDDQGSCGCSTCPNGSAGAPYLATRLGHTLLNLSAFRLPECLLVPSEKPRLGGWSFGERLPDPAPGANSSTSGPRTRAKVWYNQKGFHSLPSYLNHLNNLILWRLLPPAADWRQYGITLYSHPYGGAFLDEDKILESIRQCGVALCIVLGFSILSASIGSSAVRDRVTGAKRLQHISGLGYGTYWFTNFLYDMLLHCVSVCLSIAVIAAFQLPAFTFRANLAATALLLLLFGYATLPWMYLTSRIFSSPDMAFISYVSLNFIFGLCTMLMTTMSRLLAILSKAQNLQDVYDALKWAFAVFPQFCLGQGLIELCYNQIRHDLTRGFGVDAYASPFEMSFLGWLFVLLAAQGTVLLVLRVLLHWDLVHRSRARRAAQGAVPSCQDADVERERVRVLQGGTGGDVLVLHDLRKSHRGLCRRSAAVRGVSVGVARGECFGLLGVNGAGKTTTFKMLSGDVAPTSGHAAVRTRTGEDVALSAAGSAGVRIGYCPQQDALDQLLTGWEHLRYYCSLRGVPTPRIPQVAGDLVRRLHLEAHVDKPVATYSGGTKRKLSTALALLGKPDLLLLDEPSSGMDPCSKRVLWKVILDEVRRGCAVVLTTHSMEECEALCTRLAIMVDGSFRCLGSPQHIKSRFGGGHTVRVWLRGHGGRPDAVSRCLELCAPGARFKGQRLNLLEYHVPERCGCLADLFKVLETNKALLGIQHYSINQTTLEQVFIGFATEQPQTAADPSADGCRAGPLPV